ncbi:response regulator [Patescibacteria group bacterium]|nr:response regulator [Patescibacteria group bacterium]
MRTAISALDAFVAFAPLAPSKIMSKKILFVEDEPDLQKTLGSVLENIGFEVVSAFDGEAAVTLAKQHLPDLILLDLILPKKDGFQVLEEIKKEESTKRIPVIILSNLESINEIERAIELGATTYLIKTNYRLDEVIDKIKNIIG